MLAFVSARRLPFRPSPLRAGLAFVLGALATCAHAAPTFSFGGFGTLTAVHSTERQADYTASPISPGTAGYGKQWAFDVDTRAGAQVRAQFDRRWSAVVQVVEERGVDHSYAPHLEWANVKFQVTPDLALRAGRIALPLFLTADYRKAGYALPWLRAPVELYSIMPISNSDGLDASYRWDGFGARHETQLMAGRASVDLAPGISGRTDRVLGITHTASAGALTVRGTAARANLKIGGAEEYFDAFRSFGPTGVALADRYDIANRNVVVLSAGFSYDPGGWFVMGEIGRVNTRSVLGDQTAGYLSGGYRIGTLTPYATYAKVDVNMPTSTEGLPVAGLPPQLGGLATLLNTDLNNRLRSIGVQDTASIGLRWDFARNFAWKMQLDRVQPKGGSMGTLTNVQPGFRSGHAFGVVSAGIDFVF
ncbi:hypothetical protein IP91_00749 [Pseudoduganella lurida]|uniref:Porin n=1 Tax=Pseudoduganella lurida TaxID=1036180 RepID=A0A562RMJ6_9BURK|nr:hypothetical protein IP91_00749 [Pseudoduganella lurida]